MYYLNVKKLDFYLYFFIFIRGYKMGLRFEDLDEITRRYMLEEIDHTVGRNDLFRCEEFTDDGWKKYPDLLRKAVQEGDDDFLGVILYHNDCFRFDSIRESYTKFSELVFNRFYIRALCRRVIDEGKKLKVYMAKPIEETPETEVELGKFVNPEELLFQLRDQEKRGTPVEIVMDIALDPNSGITVRLVD